MQKYTSLEAFLGDLDEDKRAQVNALRDLIRSVDPNVKEHIKWNAPSYVWDGEDRITFNLLNKQNVVKLVLHMGVTRKENKNAAPIMKDETKLVEWSSDIRGMMTFHSIDEITAQSVLIQKIIKDWLSIPVGEGA